MESPFDSSITLTAPQVAAMRTPRETSSLSELIRMNEELLAVNAKFAAAQDKLVQAEKLASIGQLAAGVAHEINNPIGYIFSNFSTLEMYLGDLLNIIDAFEKTESSLGDIPAARQLKDIRERFDLDFLKEDIPVLMRESKEGITRVRKIVQDLKDFSRIDVNQEWMWADVHQGLDSTLNIVNNEIKYKAEIVKCYGTLPQIECLPSELNQVFMNLLVNAAQAIDHKHGRININTWATASHIVVEVRDNGCGIPRENIKRLFDPFYTTKPVGQGTGLGLALAYAIVEKHSGQLEVESEVARGSTFRVHLPIRRNVVEKGPSL